jgi:hypothetical protein
MKNRISMTVNIDIADRLDRERVYRDLAIDIVRKMSAQDLNALFAFRTVNPFSEESKRRINSLWITGEEREFLISLQNKNVLLLEATLRNKEVAP